MRHAITLFAIISLAVMICFCGCMQLPSATPRKMALESTPTPATSPSPLPTPTPSPEPTPTPKPSLPALNAKAQVALDYFLAVALNSEYHGAEGKGIIKRWEQPITFEVTGKYTKKDMQCIDNFIKALSTVEGIPPVSRAEKDGNNKLYFVTLDELAGVCPGYVSGNWAYTTAYWLDYKMDSTLSGVAIDVTNQKQRNHLIIERLTDSLGLLDDVNKYPDSIFYDKWTETQKLSDLDWLLIRMLYSPAVKAGMGAEEATENLILWLAAQADIK
jgi:hypothetical protein